MLRVLPVVFAVALIAVGCSKQQSSDVRGITSVLVARHGKLVVERYYGGTRADDRLPVFSITKSVVSALVGIAIADGSLRGVDAPLPWRPEVTLGELLSMTAGYGRSAGFGDADAPALARRPLANAPGTTFAYDSGSTDLVADLLERATGMPVAEYARRRLFGPLGIAGARWPGGHGASGLLLRPRDLLAFGQLYLDGGARRGRQIVPTSWVRQSTRPHVRVARGLSYGYGWWIRPSSFAGYGYLGQVLAVFPRRDEVVLVTSSREDARPIELVRRLARG